MNMIVSVIILLSIAEILVVAKCDLLVMFFSKVSVKQF